MAPKSLKKYYIGILVIVLISAGLLIYAISQTANAKKDNLTNKSVEDIGTNLDSFIITKNKVPSTLSEAGIKNVPSTISYQKLSVSKYKVCIYYYSSSNSLNEGWTSLVSGSLPSSTVQDNSSYFDSLVEFSHKKGENCQTIKPSLFDPGGQMCPLNSFDCTDSFPDSAPPTST